MKQNLSKKISLVIITLIYISAFLLAWAVNNLFKSKGLLISVFLADAAATVLVWIFGIIFKNSSVYDPYWSVAPIAILIYWLFSKGKSISAADYILTAVILFWGVRLTLNWAVNWRGMGHEDWRYIMFRKKSGKLWQAVNLFGINMMPTVLVYLGMIPVYFIIFNQSLSGPLFYFGLIIAAAGPVIQLISDSQMRRHRSKNAHTNIGTGLWKYSRHPNYFGEVIFWWGLFIAQMGAAEGTVHSAAGAVLITLLFLFVSIPMMEKHVEERLEGYQNYKGRVSAMVPWVNKNKL